MKNTCSRWLCVWTTFPSPWSSSRASTTRTAKLDAARRHGGRGRLARLGLCKIDQRVVVAPAIAEGITAIEGEAAYYSTIQAGSGNNQNSMGSRSFGSFGSFGGGGGSR